MTRQRLQRLLRAWGPLLRGLVFLAHVFLLLVWAGGVFVLLGMAFTSSLEIIPRILMGGVAVFMAWGLWLQLLEFWGGWFGRRVR
ncbi:hypothetical protein LLE81_00250 [Staphylococcus epidermidis]|nr:hypothetical protein [Staphylococcus epidermidis]